MLTGVKNAYRSVGSVVLATLLVVAVLPVGALPVGAALTGTVEVMPLGDSITVGVLVSSNDTGYRRELWLSQAAAGHTLNFVGSGSTGVPGDFDKRHEGHAGMRADEIRDGVTGWLNANSADVVLLHIGTNDISQGQDASSTAIEIGQILNKIKAVDSTTWVIVAKIVPRNDGNNDLQLRTNDLNNRIANLVTARSAAGDRVRLVDMNSPLDPADLADRVHPGDSGYSKMATAWDAALDELLGPDTTRPVITLVGANPQTVEVGRAYVELGATATDNVDGDLSDEIVIDASAVDTGSPGSYSVTYNVSDSAGNDAVQKVRTVQVVEVPVPPVGGGGGVGPSVLPVVIVNSCPDTIPAAGFTDLGGLSGESKHAVDCLVLHEISQGTSTDTFSPLHSVTRWQMALFLTRQLTVHGVSLPVAIDQSFSDIGDLPIATKDAINRLASLGIAKGTGETTYDPGAPVSRWQMAFFLTRLLAVVGVSLETSPPSQFLDIGELPASTQLVVNQLVAAQIINGTSATTFNPHADVLRWHMALFLTRVLSAGGVTLE